MNSNAPQVNRLFPRVLLVALVLLLLALTWRAARAGYGALLTAYAARTSRLSTVDSAIRMSPKAADAHYVRAVILEASDLPAAVREHAEAVKARPNDFALWLSFARALELNGEVEQAIAAARQATILAPAYSQPHYQLGNLLLRSGQTTAAFSELRLAGASDPLLMPGIVSLAWSVSSGNAQFVEDAINARTAETSLVLATFFRQHQQVERAIRWFAVSGPAAERDRRAYVAELITTGQFEAAAQLWAVDSSEPVQSESIRNAGFEKDIDLRYAGFDWNTSPAVKNVRFALDTQNPAEGRSALRVEFAGDSQISLPLLSQVVLVAPNTRYELQFSARQDSIVSGGVPQILVLDAVSRSPLGQSGPLMGTSQGWHVEAVPFSTGAQTKAIRIAIERQSCESTPCPIFGRLWLDKLVLSRM